MPEAVDMMIMNVGGFEELDWGIETAVVEAMLAARSSGVEETGTGKFGL